MELKDFNYDLPKELIAQEPLKKRSNSRLMILSDKIEHKRFIDILDYFSKGDVLVLNDSKVFPARLKGRRETGGKCGLLLLEKKGRVWNALITGRVKEGQKIFFSNKVYCKVMRRDERRDEVSQVKFNTSIEKYLDKLGQMPIPPYIRKELKNKERYNTVYSKKVGSVAAPTAGFHFTKELLSKLTKKGVKICYVTLHVGLGTFFPVKTKIKEHKMHEEYFTIPEKTSKIINECKGKLFIVGTTTLRTLESNCENGKVIPCSGKTKLFIYPPYDFKLKFDYLITNFHLPKSTLLMLVSAIVGRQKILDTYKMAIIKRYRFFSFGDAMLITSQTQ